MDLERDAEDVRAVFIAVTCCTFVQAAICIYNNAVMLYETKQKRIFNRHIDTSAVFSFSVTSLTGILNSLKANSHIPCRAHVVPLTV
jgi:hypothetical protein